MAGSSSFRPNFFFFPFTIGYIQEPFLPRAFTARPSKRRKKNKTRTIRVFLKLGSTVDKSTRRRITKHGTDTLTVRAYTQQEAGLEPITALP